MLTYIGEFRELDPTQTDFPSIKDYVSDIPFEGKQEVIDYLKHGGTEVLYSMVSEKDVFTGNNIKLPDVGRSDEKYTWWTSLAYYVDKYNLRLPKEFEEYAIQKYSKLVL